MYKYTPDKNILRGLRKIRKEMYVNGKEYAYITQYAPTYSQYVSFSRNYDGFVFFSPVKLREVPLSGILFPVSIFTEEVL